MDLQKENFNKDPFQEILDIKLLLPILESRFPNSANIYNLALMQKNFKEEMKFYSLNGEISEKCWIMEIYNREDYGAEICISAPPNPNFTVEIKTAFITTSRIDWKSPFYFTAIERSYSAKIFEICAFEKGITVTFIPCKFFVAEENLVKDEFDQDPEIELKELDPISGAEFLVSPWKYKINGTLQYTTKMLERNPSLGIYWKGQLVSGIATVSHGMMGFLYTDKSHRNKNYGNICMKNLAIKLKNIGFYPCLMVEGKNYPSLNLHKKVGMKFVSNVDDIYFYD